MALSFTAGTVIIFISGLAWLGQFLPAGHLLQSGLWPLLPGATMMLSPALKRFFEQRTK
jgi:hypothetical protein